MAHRAMSACGCDAGGFFVSPSGMAYEALKPTMFHSWTSMAAGSAAAAPRANGASIATFSNHGTMSPRSFTRIPHKRRRSPATAGAFRHSITWWRLRVAATSAARPITHSVHRSFGCGDGRLEGSQGVSARQSWRHCDRRRPSLPPSRWPARSKTSRYNTVRRCPSGKSVFSMTPRCAAWSRSSALTGNRMQWTPISSLAELCLILRRKLIMPGVDTPSPTESSSLTPSRASSDPRNTARPKPRQGCALQVSNRDC